MNITSERPSVGRIYDYLLGGHHNFPVDRQAAEQLLTQIPMARKLAQLNRWFLQLIGASWAEQGIERVLDLGSGLPTAGHFNEYLPAAQILFTDNDPLSVSMGAEILKGRPQHLYVAAEMTQPEFLITTARTFFGARKRLAIGCIGVSYFLPSESVQVLARRLHELCGEGSVMGLSYLSRPEGTALSARTDAALALYKRLTGAEPFVRSAEQIAQLFRPWQVQEAHSLEEWLDLKEFISPAEREGFGFDFNGMLLTH